MRGFLLLSLGVFSFSALAADLPGSHDLDILPRFPRAEIVDFRQAPSEERIYPLGAISRISGRLRMEGEVRAEGELTALTYRLPPEQQPGVRRGAHRAAQGRRHAAVLVRATRLRLQQPAGQRRVRQCQAVRPGRAAGLPAGASAAPQENSLVAVYSITRGNRRAYLQAEELKADAPLAELLPSPATLLRLLKANGELTLSHAGGAGRLLVELLVRTLRLDTGVRVELSGKHAQEWRDALRGQGVLNSRMEPGQSEVEGLHLNWLR